MYFKLISMSSSEGMFRPLYLARYNAFLTSISEDLVTAQGQNPFQNKWGIYKHYSRLDILNKPMPAVGLPDLNFFLSRSAAIYERFRIKTDLGVSVRQAVIRQY